MMRDRRLANRKTSAQPLASHFRLLRDVFENLEPSRVGERLGDPLELISVHEQPYSTGSTIDR